MFNLTDYTELKRLLTELAAVEDALMANELEMLHSLRDKYAEPITVDPFDTAALNVMLRNIEVRKGYKFDPKKDAGRVIDLARGGKADAED
ncbi:MAG: hypothetical protein HOL41_12385 [Rhodospirillaceae bacterium]|jgi:hypothetical protein|nr:hypothetical protein [Rhodospirillaceae bacterium]